MTIYAFELPAGSLVFNDAGDIVGYGRTHGPCSVCDLEEHWCEIRDEEGVRLFRAKYRNFVAALGRPSIEPSMIEVGVEVTDPEMEWKFVAYAQWLDVEGDNTEVMLFRTSQP